MANDGQEVTRLLFARTCEFTSRDGQMNSNGYPVYDGVVVNGYFDRYDETEMTIAKRPGQATSADATLVFTSTLYTQPIGIFTAGPNTYGFYFDVNTTGNSYLRIVYYAYEPGTGSVNASVVQSPIISSYGLNISYPSASARFAYNPSNQDIMIAVTCAGINEVSFFVYNPFSRTFTNVTSTIVAAAGTNSFAGDVAFLDGYFFIVDTIGRVWNSGLNNSASWNSVSYVGVPVDIGVPTAIASHMGNIIVFGSSGYIGFYDAGISAPASPLAPTPAFRGNVGVVVRQATNITHGYDARPLLTSTALSLYWVGKDYSGRYGIFALHGTEFVKISTTAVDRWLETNQANLFYPFAPTLNGITYAYAFSALVVMPCAGHTFLNFAGMVYDIVTSKWSVWTSNISGTESPMGFYGAADSFYSGVTVYMTFSPSNTQPIYTLNQNQYVDNPNYSSLSEINFRLITQEFDKTDNWKFLSCLDLVADRVNTVVLISWTDTDYASFSSPPLGVIPSTQKTNIYRLGRTRRRAFQFLHSDNTPLRMHFIDIYYSEGNN